ncbi:MAG: FAD-binding oxidoreductase [Ornithinimicrobium sp.]
MSSSVSGQAPVTSTVSPSTATEAADLLADTNGSVLILGGRTKADWGGRVDHPDVVLDTSAMRGLITHNPADMTASVRAGTTLTSLQQHLAASDQWLAIDPATATRGATIGGLLATGDSGPSRLRYGGMRDLVIGVTLVLADGAIGRSGGHVIKNVAGYDLAKLMNGSLGSLALVAEVVVRLHPLPQSVTVAGVTGLDGAVRVTAALGRSSLDPAAVEWSSPAQQILVRLEGSSEHRAHASAAVRSILHEHAMDSEVLEPEEAASAWRGQAEQVLGDPEETVARICSLPSDVTSLASAARRASAEHGVEVSVVSSLALGIHTVRFRGAAAQGHARAMADLRDEARRRGASVLLRQRPRGVEEHLSALGEPPSSIEVLRRVKSAFDPTSRLAPGRFEGWY